MRSPYITAEGYAALEREHRALWTRRREVVAHLAAAAAEGDRSENAEYIYRKKELRELDRRIRYLQKRLPELKVVDRPPADPETVRFGAWVELRDEAEGRQWLRIVGPDEIDAAPGRISIDAPLARALIGRRAGDAVEVHTPQGGRRRYVLLAVAYRDPSAASTASTP